MSAVTSQELLTIYSANNKTFYFECHDAERRYFWIIEEDLSLLKLSMIDNQTERPIIWWETHENKNTTHRLFVKDENAKKIEKICEEYIVMYDIEYG